jgi:predicted CoA-substrate-specific enzyme activase
MKVPFFCSYIPAPLLEALGCELVDITLFTEESCSLEYSCVLHDNLCSYAKYLLKHILAEEGRFDVAVVPNTCNAMKKLHDALTATGRIPAHLLDIPRRSGQESARYLAEQYRSLIEKIAPDFNSGKLLEHLSATVYRTSPLVKTTGDEPENRFLTVGIAGSSYSHSFFNTILAQRNTGAIFLSHCGYRPFSALPEELPPSSLDDLLFLLARQALQKSVCPRSDRGGMATYLLEEIREKNLAGLIITSLKFCDFYAFEMEKVRKQLPEDFPLLYMENDLSVGNDEQNRTRVEAFLEKVCPVRVKGVHLGKPPGFYEARERITMGIDIGSAMTKGVLMKGGRDILTSILLPTSVNMKDGAGEAMESLLMNAGITRRDVTRIVMTGYGRTAFPESEQVTEITCHALGVHFLHSGEATVIDIGGQDSKAIRIDAEGRVLRFTMNDKCAAGTGKFLESMVKRLNISYDAFSALSMTAPQATPISSMCSVFAESEVVSLMAKGVPAANIARGLNAAVAGRVRGLTGKIQGAPPYILTGGLSHNAGFIRELETALASPVAVFDESQLAGAIGAALAALSGIEEAC